MRGLDLAGAITPVEVATLHEAFLAHGLLLFRDQALDETQQVAFGALFGPVEKVRSPDEGAAGAPRIRYVTDREVGGRAGILPSGPMDLHCDYCFRESPYKATMLHCLEAPTTGGATIFADTGLAFTALASDAKQHLLGLRALNAYGGQATRRPARPEPDALTHEHPAVIEHPETGQPLLFVNRLMTDHLSGLNRADSDALLESLFDHIEQPAHLYRHRWVPGDVVIWDNVRLQHGRDDFEPTEPRLMRRITISGVPVRGASA